MSTIVPIFQALEPGRIMDSLSQQASNIIEINQAIGNSMLTSAPILFFPLRVEAKFKGQELWVRAYPDEIGVQQHDPRLSETEKRAGQDYWAKRWDLEKAGAEGLAVKTERLWINLAHYFSSGRAAWIIRQTKPGNWEQREQDQKPAFAELPIRPENQSAPSDCRVLPDRLAVLLETETGEIIVQEGAPIGRRMLVGPDLSVSDNNEFSDPSARIVNENGDIKYGEKLVWLADFEIAVKRGMGFKINLSPTNSSTQVNQIKWLLVVGLKTGTEPSRSAALFEDLLQAHYFSGKGFTLVPQGTPTNSTEEVDSGYNQRASVVLSDYRAFSERIPEEAEQGRKTDQQRLAELLGLDFNATILRETGPHRQIGEDGKPGLADHREAVLMNRSLYPATLGYYAMYALNGLVEWPILPTLRKFFVEQISGRGPLPAIRTGNQPYGFVLTADFPNWEPAPGITDGQRLLTRLAQLAERELSPLALDVPHLGQVFDEFGQKVENNKLLMKLLEQHPASIRFSFRNLILNGQNELSERLLRKEVWPSIADHSIDSVLNPPVIQFHQDWKTKFPNHTITEGRALSETELLNPNYILWLLEELPRMLRELNSSQNLDLKPEGMEHPPLLFLLLRSALLRQLYHCAVLFLKQEGLLPAGPVTHVGEPTLVPMDFLIIQLNELYGTGLVNREVEEFCLAEYLLKLQMDSLQELSKRNEKELEALVNNELSRKLIRNPNPLDPELVKEYNELLYLLQALALLSKMPTARLERCLAEHIDTLSYRLDAWITALLAGRLDDSRKPQAGGIPHEPKGFYLGAYGWLLDLHRSPSTKQPEGGYLHAPSLAQAATGALLKCGFLSHNSSSGAFAVDLSSQRVRHGLFLLEGLQNGHELAALLGYQFERAMHDAGLDVHILPIRDQYPLEKKRLPQSGVQNGEPVLPGPVTDGLKLLADRGSKYLEPLHNGNANKSDVADQILKLIEAVDGSVDSLSDLLLAEAVHQYANGNTERANGLLKALSEGTIPPTLEFIQTPRTHQHLLTHRLAVLLDYRRPLEKGLTPRARIEPQLNEWLGKVIGPLERTGFKVFAGDANSGETLSLADLGLQAIDIVYVVPEQLPIGGSPGQARAAGDSEWEQRIARAYREKTGASDASPVYVNYYDFDSKEHTYSFSEKYFLILRLKNLLANARPLARQNFEVSKQSNGTAAMPVGLGAQYDSATKALEKIRDKTNVREALMEGSLFGIKEANLILTTEEDEALKTAFINVKAEITRRIEEGDKLIQSQQTDAYIQAIKTLFNHTIQPLPSFQFDGKLAGYIQEADKNQEALLSYARTASGFPNNGLLLDDWLDGLHHVRPNVGAFRWVRLLSERLDGEKMHLRAWQLPYEKEDQWLGGMFQGRWQGEKVSIVGQYMQSANSELGRGDYCGLLIDDWVETIPSEEETTGIALNYNKPNSEPPQALLLAVKSDLQEQWALPEIVRSVLYALKLSALRGVEAEAIGQSKWRGFLPAVIGETAAQHISAIFQKQA